MTLHLAAKGELLYAWKANNASHILSPDYDGGETYSPPNLNR
jgi:hypothetical protein